MNRTKYVIIESNDVPVAIIFNLLVSHDMFKCWRPVSAGFVDIVADAPNTIRVSVFGKSTSLKLKSNPEDADIIKKAIVPEQY